jgi:hypothetical protein
MALNDFVSSWDPYKELLKQLYEAQQQPTDAKSVGGHQVEMLRRMLEIVAENMGAQTGVGMFRQRFGNLPGWRRSPAGHNSRLRETLSQQSPRHHFLKT